jgi:hypothetical protein
MIFLTLKQVFKLKATNYDLLPVPRDLNFHLKIAPDNWRAMLCKRGRSIGGETIAWAHLGALDYSVPKIYQKKLAHEKSKKKK